MPLQAVQVTPSFASNAREAGGNHANLDNPDDEVIE
jgi:hypothetical protein